MVTSTRAGSDSAVPVEFEEGGGAYALWNIDLRPVNALSDDDVGSNRVVESRTHERNGSSGIRVGDIAEPLQAGYWKPGVRSRVVVRSVPIRQADRCVRVAVKLSVGYVESGTWTLRGVTCWR